MRLESVDVFITVLFVVLFLDMNDNRVIGLNIFIQNLIINSITLQLFLIVLIFLFDNFNSYTMRNSII